MRKNNNIKFFIFILLFLSLGIINAPSTFAALSSPGGGGSGDFGDGGLIEEQANLGWGLDKVAYCWSSAENSGWKYPASSDEKKKLDAPVGAFAHLTFDNSGAFNAEASSSENVTEYGGLNKNPVLCSRTGINKK